MPLYTKLLHEDLRWALRRTPTCVLQLLKAHPGRAFVGGGFLRACVAGEKASDVDIFAPSEPDARSYAVFLQSKAQGARLHETENAFTVHGGGLPLSLQVIHRWAYDNAEALVSSFDFTIAMAAFWWEGDDAQGNDSRYVPQPHWESLCDFRFYHDLAAKRLRYTAPSREEDAGGSMLRVLKFYQRGYRIPLDSLGAVIARLSCGVRQYGQSEQDFAKVLTGLLREVDPNVDPTHIAHLPASAKDDELMEEVPHAED